MVEASDEANCPSFIQDQYFFKKSEPCVIEDLLKGQDSGILTYSSDMIEEVTKDAQQTPNFG